MTDERDEAVTEAELHAYLDGELGQDRRRAVERHLAEHPDDARRLDRYRAHAALAARAYAPLLDRPVPPALLPAAALPPRPQPAANPWRSAARAAAVVVAFIAGASAGWLAHVKLESGQVERSLDAGGFVGGALAAYRAYAPEERHPVEVRADEKDLVAWLSKRLGVSLKAPQVPGWELVGGRLLPGRTRPAALFLYQDAAGRRITLYCLPSETRSDTSMQFVREGSLGSYYWSDNGLGWAVSGELDRQALLSVATGLYAALD